MEENARAAAMVNELLSQVWQESGQQAAELFVLQQLELILAEAGQISNRVNLQQVHVIDNGDGQAVSSLINVYPSLMGDYLRSVENLLGVQLTPANSN